MPSNFNLEGTSKNFGLFEIAWTEENREKIEICLMQGGLVLQSAVLSPVSGLMSINPISSNGINISGQVQLVLGDQIDRLVADLKWSGRQTGSYSGILAKFS